MILFLLLLLSVNIGITKSSVDFSFRFISSSVGEVFVVVYGVILYVNKNLDNRLSRVPQVRRFSHPFTVSTARSAIPVVEG